MDDRAGPPTPRSRPQQYAERDAAWRRFRDDNCANWTPRDEDAAKGGFLAGWSSRKEAEYQAVVKNLQEALDRRPPVVATMFPTEAELEGRN